MRTLLLSCVAVVACQSERAPVTGVPSAPRAVVSVPREPCGVAAVADVACPYGASDHPITAAFASDAGRCVEAGPLTVTSGAVTLSDPFAYPGRSSLPGKVPPGQYRVVVRMVEDLPALALLVLERGVPVRWEPLELEGDTIGGRVMVDAGTVGFADRDVVAPLATEDGNRALLAVGSDVFQFCPAPDLAGNLVAMRSGWGDGLYRVLLGRDADERPVAIAVDFQVLDTGDGTHPYADTLRGGPKPE